jgi:hypothetical protein
MKHLLMLACAAGLVAATAHAVLQIDVPATLFPTGHDGYVDSFAGPLDPNNGPFAAVMNTMDNVARPATRIVGPDGFPLAYHLIFDYDAAPPPVPVVTTVSMTAGSCSKVWTPLNFSVLYSAGPNFPIDWAFNGSVAPDNAPYDLCSCWPDDPACGEPDCALSDDELDLGLVLPGVPTPFSFTITNVGSGILAGTVSEDCATVVLSDGLVYSLGAGQSQVVSGEFLGQAPGSVQCWLDVGGPCEGLWLTAEVAVVPICQVSPTSLDFGAVQAGTPVLRTLTVTNAGGGVLEGVVSSDCPAFTVLSGASYSLAAEESQEVVVRFLSSVFGEHVCTLDTGGDCPGVACVGEVELPPACSIDPSVLQFGILEPGDMAELDFVVTNSGGGILAGIFQEGCAQYSIVAGESYSLAAGESQDVTVRFQSDTPGYYPCPVIGTTCPNTILPCLATVVAPIPVCAIEPDTLDFGTVPPGTPVALAFTITNEGYGVLAGSVASPCPPYSVVAGGEYSLGAGQSQVVDVLFTAPATPASYPCLLDTGAGCLDLTCLGVSDPLPACLVDPAALDFGTVLPGTPVARSFTLANTGGGLLAGTVTSPCPSYTITAGAAYSLAAGESQEVELLFTAPAQPGPYPCLLDTGGACADVACTAAVELAPACLVEPLALDFGAVAPGVPVTRTFTITNTGGGLLAGMVVEDCPAYSIVSEAGYSLAAGQNQTFTIQMQSATVGTHLCQVGTGEGCGPVACAGMVELPPACEISVAELDFGRVLPGTPVMRSFTITNTGGGILGGSVVDACESFTVVAGGTYSLGGGQSQNVELRFLSNTAGDYQCQLDPGGGCPPLALGGSAMWLDIVTGEASACGPVDNLGHLPGSLTGFAPEWAIGSIGLLMANDGSLTVAVSIHVNGVQVWSGPTNSSSWLSSEAAGFDLSDWFDENIQLHLEVSDGVSVWNAGGELCLWDLSFLDLTNSLRPTAFLLHEPMPNPFNPATRLRLDLPAADVVRLAVLDLQGRQVALLADQALPAGSHDFIWRPRHTASGTYFIAVECRQGVQVRKVLFLK